ncbi:TLC domain-containing protein [Gymnopilus junonius]|uniref:TLC domain-containing protein n=1 Tax=Gymnopilus junonius TaxID=109634 RepID=A0A9P5P377_GYMJU|nr:TLC domain-containing protein [Gymnopilus junonius]
MSSKSRKRPSPLQTKTNGIEQDPTHHLTGPFLPQTPLDAPTPRSASPAFAKAWAAKQANRSAWVRWAVEPVASFKLLLLPIVLHLNWELVAPYVNPGIENPFSGLFLLKGRVPGSPPEDPRYQKSWWDLAFLAYYVVFFSFVRESLALRVSRPAAKYFGLKRETKVDRFGEQTYALFYFAAFGTWGYFVMRNLPTYWYNTNEFWLGYPHWDMRPDLKRYYLMQFSYWLQQLIVLVLGLEKPRKDYMELVAHHIVTLWLVGWSYLINLTYIGNAVYMSMDIPDTFLAFSKLLNYIQWNTAKLYAYVLFFAIWTYFRHYLNIRILWSVWYELPNIPEWTKKWSWSEGVYLVGWMRYQVFIPLLLLQFLNLFWYYLMVKILIRGLTSDKVSDNRSDDEDDGEEDSPDKKDE